MHSILDGLDERRLEAVVRKGLARLPHPFPASDRAAGDRDELSILQAQFARTHVLERPLSGRHLFEPIIRENFDLGRPGQVSLIFARRITKRTPGRFATRIITQGVTPSLHIRCKPTPIKPYFKADRALHTETTINNPRGFALGRRRHNLPALRAIGFAANRQVLEVETLSQDYSLSEAVFNQVTRAPGVAGQRVSALALPLLDDRLTVLINAVQVKHVLTQIDAECRDVHLWTPLFTLV